MKNKRLLIMLLLALIVPWAVAQQALPYSYGFEDNNLATDGWTTTCTNSSSGIKSDAARSGSYGFTFYYSEQNGALISPLLTGSEKGVDVSLWYKEYSDSYGDEQFYVGYTTDETVTDPASFVYGSIITASTSWQEYTNTFPAGTKRIAVKYVYNDAFYLFLDDFTFEAVPSCPKPKDLEATNITAESATLTWTSIETPSNGYNVRYRVGEIQHPTFFDDFESNSLTGWTVYTDGDAPQSDGWYTFEPSTSGLAIEAHSGSYCASAWSWSSSSYNANNWLISPQVTFSKTLKFWVRTNASYPDNYEVLLSTTGTDEADFTVTLQAMAPAPATGIWEEVSIDLTAYSGTGYIAIHHVDNDKNYLLIDDFGIYDDPTPAGAWVNTTSNTNSKDITGLTESTSYDFEVQANCGGETSDWAASSFTTNPDCMPVANLAVSDATTTTISLTWTDQNGGEANYIVTDGNDNPVTVTNLTITGCTVTGLTANTAYTFKVTADCGSTAESINARTDCNALSTLPYEEGFEASSVNVYCWDLDGFNRLNNSTYAHTGDGSIYSQEALAYAILPATTTNISDLMLNFWWYNANSGNDLGSLAVGYLTDETDYSTFVTVGTIDMSNSSNTYTKSDDFFFTAAPAGARIALKYTEGSSGAQVIIDDVTVDVAPSCIKPTNLEVTGGLYAVVSWTGTADSFDIAFSDDSTVDPGTVIVGNTDQNSFELYNAVTLAEGTYTVWVRANCGSDNSVWASTTLTLQYCTPNPTSHDGKGITGVSFGTGSYVVNNGDGSASIPATAPFYGNYASMIGAVNAGVESTIAITTGTGGYPYTFVIWVDLDNDFTFEDTEVLYIGKAASGNGTLNATITVPATQTLGDYRMRIYGADSYFTSFYNNGNTNWTAAHDPCSAGTYRHAHDYTLRVLEAPNCLAPSDLAATNITAHTAELSWTANSSESEWTIYYKKASDTDYTEVKNVTDNPYTLSGLNAGTDYDYYVVANCSGTETSDPSSTFNFTTECEAFTITATDKYTQDFESPVVTSTYSSTTDLHVPSCWENPYTTGSSAAGQPHLIAKGSNYNYSSNQVLNFYGSGSNYVTLPEFTNDLQDLQISFKWATESNSNGTLTLGYITDGDVNYNTFTEITGASYPASSSSYHTLIQADPVDLSSLPSAAKRLAFRWVYSNQYSCNVDDLVVELIPSCKLPTNFTCTDYTATTATFDWTANGANQTAWQLYISETNVAPADNIDLSEVIDANTHPFTVTSGLTAEHTYYAWVRGNCTASSEGYSEWVGGIEFMPSQYKDFTYQETATSSTSYIPVYGSYCSNATNKGQILIPASAFPADMADATVRRLTFYTTSSYASVNWGTAEFDVLVTEVDATSFATAEFFDWNAMTTVYSGSLSVSGNQMVIDLDTPFSYTGGNLVIGFNLTTTGTNASVQWVATYGSIYLGAYQYGTNSVSRSMYQPKTTFNYLPSPTPRPINPHATEELSTEATLAWTAPNSTEVTGYQYQYKLATATDWPTTWTDETGLTATLTGLATETTYDFRVRAVYPGPAYSQYAETQFTTTASCPIPTGLAAANLTMNTADLTWNASVEVANYTVEYRTAAGNNGSMLNEDFAGLTSGIPAEWDNSEGTTSNADYKWTYYNNGHDAAPCLRFNSYMNSNNLTNFLKTPSMNFPAGKTMQLIFWWKNPKGGDFSVYISTDGGTTKTALKEGLTGQTSWKEETIDLTGYEGASNVTIHFKGTSNYGSGDAYIYLDEVVIGEVNAAGAWTAATTTAPNTGVYTLAGLTAGTKYDVRVYAECASNPETENALITFTTLADGTMVFTNASGDGMWSTADNWTPNVPTIADNAVLRANATINGDAAAKKITFEGTTTPTLTIADGGQLQTNTAVTATVKKTINAYPTEGTAGYYLIGNPLSTTIYSSGIPATGMTTGSYDLYQWNYAGTNDLEWRNYKAGTFSLYNGQGYLYANAANTELTFTGSVLANNTEVTKTSSYASTDYQFNGWSLWANPFVCNAYVTEANSELAFYRMNAAGDGFEAATGAIAPMEGIFVQATATEQTFKFTRTAPSASPGQGNLNINMAQVVTTRDEMPATDNAIVRFNGGSTLEKFSFREGSSKVYIPQDGKDYAVVSAEAQGELPLNFQAEKNSRYTLSFTAQDVDFSYLHLIDNITGADVDLLDTPSYSFDARLTDYASRFRLVFATGSSVDGDSFAFINGNGSLCIYGIDGTATLQVIDLMGRVLSSETFSGNIEKKIDGTAGVYMLRLINGNDVKVQKIVVR